MHRILIVDDNPAIRESLCDALAAEGYVVDGAPDGLAALRAAQQRPPAVILLDLTMPGIEGGAVASRLAQAGCAAPVIVLSADRAGADRARAMGAAGFLAKPFDLNALVELIERLTTK